jgi:hypothetical protein
MSHEIPVHTTLACITATDPTSRSDKFGRAKACGIDRSPEMRMPDPARKIAAPERTH